MKTRLLQLCLGLGLCLSLPLVTAQTQLELIYSGNLDGELEPCGCSLEGDLGGILRHATTLNDLRAKSPDLFAVSSGGLVVSMSPQDQLTGEYILKGVAQLNYDAIGVQWNDLAYGLEYTLRDKLPWVSSNWRGDEYLKSKSIERGGKIVHVFSWLDPSQSPTQNMQGDHEQLDADSTDLAAALEVAQETGLTLLTTSLSLEQAKKLPLQHVDILLIQSAYEQFGEPQYLGDTLVLEPGSRGMRLGQLQLSLNDQGRITEYKHTVLSMPNAVADADGLLAWYDEYNAKVKQAYEKKSALRKAQETGQSPYVGEQVCQSCHVEEHAIWQKSLHSNAFAKLELVNKSFDPSCIQCHTLGFEKPGGFIDFDTTPDLMNVQCENCHGAGRAHVESGGIKPLPNVDWQPQQICVQCHEKKHSPVFDFEKYWPRIQH